jgi:hypothetical protein
MHRKKESKKRNVGVVKRKYNHRKNDKRNIGREKGREKRHSLNLLLSLFPSIPKEPPKQHILIRTQLLEVPTPCSSLYESPHREEW